MKTNHLTLAERHIITQSHPHFQECQALCQLSRNLYNATLYAQRQSFFKGDFQNYYEVNRQFTHQNQVDYRALPAKVAKQTQLMVQQAFTSFFALSRARKQGTYDRPVRLPRYLKAGQGYPLLYEKGALSFKESGFIKLSKTTLRIPTKLTKEQVSNVRLTPKGNHVVIEVLYRVPQPVLSQPDFKRVAFVDPGMNHLMTVTSNVFHPLLYNGRLAKAINQGYNKERARLQSQLPVIEVDGLKTQVKTSRKIQNLTMRRNFRIHDLFHKITTHLVNHLVEHKVDTLLFGHNLGQKQDIKLGRRTNQQFVNLPFTKLIQMLTYKCQRAGIHFIVTEESYTSKCSFLDQESVEHHETYSGRRVSRGLFRTGQGKCVNADVNGSLNIGRKYLTGIGVYSDALHVELVQWLSNPHKVNVTYH